MPRTVYLFPGQGSQKVGMGRDFVERYPDLRSRYFDVADEILGFPLSRLCFEGPDDELRQTQNTQPAILLVSVAVLDVLRSHGIQAQAAAGHSLGEYSALVAAGVLEFADALALVRRRGELMARVNERTPGTMVVVVGLSPERVDGICAEVRASGTGIVEPANYNEPQQTVISGELGAVEHAAEQAQHEGARITRIRVGAPFHCSLMAELEAEFASDLESATFRDPLLPIIANVTGDYVRTAEEVRDCLRRQIAGSVRWTETMRRLMDDGYDTIVEVGPGRVLGGFAKRVATDATVLSTSGVEQADKVVEALVTDPA